MMWRTMILPHVLWALLMHPMRAWEGYESALRFIRAGGRSPHIKHWRDT
jgi:hypothetical protein